MKLREYRWEDLETLRKYFGTTQETISDELHVARTTISMVNKGTISEKRKRHYEKIVGMAWEIFAIYYVQSYRVTKDMDPHDCYNFLLYYVNEMKDLPKVDRINFSEWYMRLEDEER